MQNALIILATRMLLKAPPNVGCQPLRENNLLLGCSLTSSLPSPMIACRSIRSTVLVVAARGRNSVAPSLKLMLFIAIGLQDQPHLSFWV